MLMDFFPQELRTLRSLVHNIELSQTFALVYGTIVANFNNSFNIELYIISDVCSSLQLTILSWASASWSQICLHISVISIDHSSLLTIHDVIITYNYLVIIIIGTNIERQKSTVNIYREKRLVKASEVN